MNTNDHGRKEPSLADLEAFEALLRESLQEEPVIAASGAAKTAAATPAAAAAPAAAVSASFSAADRDAMAELTRLIEQPLDFSLPDMKAPPAPAVEPPYQPAPELHTHIEASFTPEWAAPQQVQAQPQPAPEPAHTLPAPLHSVSADDPLAAFEEELRRFDAARVAVPEPVADPIPDLDFSAFTFEPAATTRAEPPEALAERQRAEERAFQENPFQDMAYPAPTPEHQPVFAPPVQEPEHQMPLQPSPLEAAEQRLAAEAAAASYTGDEPQSSDVKRSRGVFMALGLLATAGLAVVGGTFVFSGAKKSSAGGDVPVIAAKTEPTKEKPTDPGGVEIPNQNAQILAGRDVTRQTKPAEQVVNTTEQPLDLKEVTRRDSVRIVAPNPFQTPATPTANDAASGVKPAEVEPRRVTSVKVPVAGEAATPSSPAAGSAAMAAAAAGAARASTPSAPKAEPKPEALRMDAPKTDAQKSDARPPKKAEPAKADPPKVAPTPKVANAASTPKAAAPEKAAPRNPNAPLPLTGDKTQNKNKDKATPAASGTYSVQLASRPTETDAKSAATSLGAKYAGQLGGKGARVVNGEANGNTVYRVRASGYSQAAATEVCNKIKAAGGACFIAKQ
jgi:hypothetical protein